MLPGSPTPLALWVGAARVLPIAGMPCSVNRLFLVALAMVGVDQLLPGQGFRPLPWLTVSNPIGGRLLGDFDNDGQVDALNWDSNGVVGFTGLNLSGPGTGMTIGPIGRPIAATADFDNNGALDLLLGPSEFVAASDIQIMFGNGDGTFGSPVVVVPGVTTYFFGVGLLAGDVTGDGRVDLVLSGTTTQAVEVYEQQQGGAFVLALSATVAGTTSVTLADVNGDTLPDIVYSDTPNSIAVIFGGNFTPGQGTAALQGLTYLVPAGDLDRDGFADVLQYLPGSVSTSASIQLHFGSGNGLVAGPVMSIAADSGVPVASDLDADGNRDLVFFIFDPNVPPAALLFRGDGSGGFSAGMALPGFDATTSFLADGDGDGDPDLFQNRPFLHYYRLHRWENRAIYGDACPGAAGAPELAIGVASPGNTNCAVELRNVPPTSLAVILASLGATAGPCGVQVDISPGSHAVLAGLANPMGELTVNWSIPTAGTTGVTLFWQGAALDPTGAFQGFGVRASATVGRAITVF